MLNHSKLLLLPVWQNSALENADEMDVHLICFSLYFSHSAKVEKFLKYSLKLTAFGAYKVLIWSRLGAVSFGYKGYRVGVNAEAARHVFQNQFAHSSIPGKEQPSFKVLNNHWYPY